MGFRSGGQAHAIRMRARRTEEDDLLSVGRRNFCLTAGLVFKVTLFIIVNSSK
jgi:hypothetical protein